MTFKEKMKKIMDIKGLNNRDLSNKIGVNESLVSRWVNAENPSLTLINHLVQVFPDIDLNYLMKQEIPGKIYQPVLDENIMGEDSNSYKKEKSPQEIIEEIESNLNILKDKLAQNSHKK